MLKSRKKTAAAAERMREHLRQRAPLVVTLLQRPWSVDSDERRDLVRLALAQLRALLESTGARKESQSVEVLANVANNRVDLAANKVASATEDAIAAASPLIATAKTTAETAIASNYTTALAVVTGMGLSAARTTTLTNALIAMRDSDSASLGAAMATASTVLADSVSSAAKDAAKGGALKCLNNASDTIANEAERGNDRCDKLTAAIAEEVSRLGL